jgi:hypothetical protein
MADDIYDAMADAYEGLSGGEEEMKKYLKVFATGIISHIQKNAQVNPGIGVQVSTGSGTGATTASGTIT